MKMQRSAGHNYLTAPQHRQQQTAGLQTANMCTLALVILAVVPQMPYQSVAQAPQLSPQIFADVCGIFPHIIFVFMTKRLSTTPESAVQAQWVRNVAGFRGVLP